jgi:hypothetical protein
MEYKIYEINGNFWGIATDIKLFTMKWRRIWKRPITYKECDIDSQGLYEPIEIYEDTQALNDKKDITIDGESYRYISFRNMLSEFALDGSPIPFWGLMF